jgi:transposase
MDVVYTRCAALDVHKKTINVCIRIGYGANLQVLTGLYGTFTADLERLRSFLHQHKVHRVIMESTGVYWIPVWNVLERGSWKFDLVLVNPQHVRALQGEKTDVKDCRRLAELGQHDLLRSSFIPPPPIRELRDLTRRRSQLQQDRNRVINRIGRLLETANIKLGSVASDIVGKTGWLILNAIANGEKDPQQLAERAQGSLQGKKVELAEALRGYTSEHFRWQLSELLEDVSRLDHKVNDIDSRLRQKMEPHQDLIRRLCTIPGVKEIAAWTLIAELGTDMTRFPTAKRAASWAGLCPGNCESAGKRHSGRTRKGDRYLRRMLIQNGWAVSHKKDCFLTALFLRVASRRGVKRAAMAVAHRVLVIAYYIIRDGTVYHELGGDHYDQKNPERTARRLTKRLESIGFQVTLAPATTAVPSPASKPIRNGTTRWDNPVRSSGRTQLKIPGPVATPDVCGKCAAKKIPCIHDPCERRPTRTSSTDKRLGRPCKCAERGIVCKHQTLAQAQAERKSSPAPSST